MIEDIMSTPLLEVPADQMRNPNYRVQVWPFVMGQRRIQLYERDAGEYDSPIRSL